MEVFLNMYLMTAISTFDVDRPCYIDDDEDVLPQSQLECIGMLSV